MTAGYIVNAAEVLRVPNRLETSATAPAERLARMPRRLTIPVNFSAILSDILLVISRPFEMQSLN
jgi:hypothetical protein